MLLPIKLVQMLTPIIMVTRLMNKQHTRPNDSKTHSFPISSTISRVKYNPNVHGSRICSMFAKYPPIKAMMNEMNIFAIFISLCVLQADHGTTRRNKLINGSWDKMPNAIPLSILNMIELSVSQIFIEPNCLLNMCFHQT